MTSLTVAETLEFSDLLAAKYIARADELTPTLIEATSVVLAARLSRYLYEQRNRPDENETLRDACVLCDGMLLEDRVTVDKRNHVVAPCWVCRPRAFCAYHAMIARHEESQEAAAGPAEGRLVGLPLPTGPGMPTDNRTTPFRRDPSPQGTPAAASCDSDDAPATLRTGAPLRPEIKRGLEMLREGSPESGQRMTTVHVLPSLRAAGLVEVRDDVYYMTRKGQEAIR